VQRLGSNADVPVDCRLIAASKSDLKILSDSGHFRADLYYRLNVVSLDLPSLRQRREDIPLLMASFLHEAAWRFERPNVGFNPADLARWTAHDWPGNIRELKNVAERWALGLPDSLQGEDRASATPCSLAEQVDTAERAIIEIAQGQCHGNVAQAAELLQTPRKILYDKLLRHDIAVEKFRPGARR